MTFLVNPMVEDATMLRLRCLQEMRAGRESLVRESVRRPQGETVSVAQSDSFPGTRGVPPFLLCFLRHRDDDVEEEQRTLPSLVLLLLLLQP